MKHDYTPFLYWLFAGLCIACLAQAAQAQSIGLIQFDRLPQNYQLYPRNAQNQANVPIAGRIAEAGWQYVSVRLFRNKQPIAYQRATVQYANGTGRFEVGPLTIRAEKAEYDISVHLVKGTDSVNVGNRTNIVAGDVLVLTGQSNASAFFRDTRTNEFCRTFGTISGNFGTNPYNPADTLWALSNQTVPTQNVGELGFGIQQYILDTYGMPTCLINGAFHWSKMEQHATRTANNPADLSNGYGRLLYRLQKAGVAGAVKALIYRQGETEAYGEATDWPGHFDRYYRNLKTDLPSIQQLYVYQIDIIEPAVAAAPAVREAQRTLLYKYPDIQVVASVGTAGFDGLHYTDAGYDQNAKEVARLIGRDIYGDDALFIDAPNLRQAYFSTPARDEITLLFDAGQLMRWNEQQGIRSLRNFIYFDGQAGAVQSGRAVENKIILTLNGPSSASKLSYLPAQYGPNLPDFPYQGPYLTNSTGLRALSFHDVPIAAPGWAPTPTLATPVLTPTTSQTAYQVRVDGVPGAVGYVLDQLFAPGTGFANNADGFERIAIAGAGIRQPVVFTGSGAPGTSRTWRIKAFNRTGESASATVTITLPNELAQPNLQAEATYANAVRLSWQPVPEATGYVVERRLSSSTSFSVLASVGAAVLSLTDNALTDNTLYVYRIKATGRFFDSPYAQAEVQTPAYLAKPTASVAVLYNNALQVSWTAVPGATRYLVEKELGGEFMSLTLVAAPATSITDAGLTPGTAHSYRLRALGDRTESPVAVLEGQTPALLTTPQLSVSVVYNNALDVQWPNVLGATRYVLERKTAEQAEYQPLGTLTTTSRRDTNLLPGTTYLYRVKAFGDRTESLVGSTTATTPALLETPPITLTIIYNNTLRVGWRPVANATGYALERATNGQPFRPVGTLAATASALVDSLLTPNTTYLYRLKAIAEKTESRVSSVSATTPALLETPVLSVSAVAFDTLRLAWKAVPGVGYYRLDRRQKGETTYAYSLQLDASTERLNDSPLLPITTYEYRLTAFADKTRSDAATTEGTTLVLLSTLPEAVAGFQLWPNPAREQVTIQFEQSLSGMVQIVDALGRVQRQQSFRQTTDVSLPLIQPGTYLIRVESERGLWVRKLIVL